MTGIILILLLAVTVEAIVEYLKSIVAAFDGADKRAAFLQLFAVVVSVLMCFAAGADLYAALGVAFEYRWVGILLTGIFASRGANYISDLIGKLNAFKDNI